MATCVCVCVTLDLNNHLIHVLQYSGAQIAVIKTKRHQGDHSTQRARSLNYTSLYVRACMYLTEVRGVKADPML